MAFAVPLFQGRAVHCQRNGRRIITAGHEGCLVGPGGSQARGVLVAHPPPVALSLREPVGIGNDGGEILGIIHTAQYQAGFGIIPLHRCGLPGGGSVAVAGIRVIEGACLQGRRDGHTGGRGWSQGCGSYGCTACAPGGITQGMLGLVACGQGSGIFIRVGRIKPVRDSGVEAAFYFCGAEMGHGVNIAEGREFLDISLGQGAGDLCGGGGVKPNHIAGAVFAQADHFMAPHKGDGGDHEILAVEHVPRSFGSVLFIEARGV